jgi:hypothetical protein
MRSAVLVAVAVAVLLAACGSSGATHSSRPTTAAKLLILSPTPNEVTGPDVTLRFQVIGGTVLAPSQVTGPLRGDQGHIHVALDGKLVQVAYSTQAQLTGLTPGLHTIQASWVATDHLPFANPVVVDVIFTVRGT